MRNALAGKGKSLPNYFALSWHGDLHTLHVTASARMLQLLSRRGTPITCASALWLTLIGLSRSQNIHVDWSSGTPHLPHLEEGQRAVGRYDDEDEPVATATVKTSVDAHAYTSASWPGYTPPSPPGASSSSEEDLEDAPVASMRATLRRMGMRLPAADDEAALRAALVAALHAAKIKLVRGLLMERGGTCVGCTERPEFVAAVLAGLRQPLVARHALPLFLYDQPLFPHTQMGLNLYEPRYKLACRKVSQSVRVRVKVEW